MSKTGQPNIRERTTDGKRRDDADRVIEAPVVRVSNGKHVNL